MKPHVDAPLHVRGESEFVDDVVPPARMLHAAVFGSPSAHGAVARLDTTRARETHGVVAVFTASDIPGTNMLGPIVQDELLLADRLVEYAGQPLAVVVAETPEDARKGVARVQVDIDERPILLDPREACARGRTFGSGRTFRIGDVDAAWPECACIVEGACDLGGQEHLYLETHRARAVPREGGALQVYSSTQSPYAAQKAIARVLGLAEHKVEIDVVRLGGGFGGKEDQATHWACMAALSAALLQRPVELVLPRLDDMRMTGKRHPYQCNFKLGLSAAGDIVALEVKYFQNAGAYADLSTAVLERSLFHSTNAYRVPNARIVAVCCKTNLPPHTAFRGFGGPQAMFVIESALARAAETLGTSREVLQYRNLLQEGDRFPYGQTAECCRAIQTWDALNAHSDIPAMRAAVDAYNRDHSITKRGLAVMPICFGISFTKTFLNQAGALVLVYTDGSVSIADGGVEMGQGNSTKLRNLAAAAFGIREERIRSESTNTRRVANMSPSAASATTDLNGRAVQNACDKILTELRAFASGKLGAPRPEAVTIVGERVLVEGVDSGWDWEKLVLQAYLNRTCLCAHGFFRTPDVHFDPETETGRPFAYHTYGAASFEVALDALRGTYEVIRIRVVHDLGRPIHPVIDRGQIEGGLAQGMGWVSMEDLQVDPRGHYRSNSLSTYKVPDVFFMPDDLDIMLLEDADNPRGVSGSKAVGEPPLMYGIGLFFALRDAMRAVRPHAKFDFHSPLTPERVLTQLDRWRTPG